LIFIHIVVSCITTATVAAVVCVDINIVVVVVSERNEKLVFNVNIMLGSTNKMFHGCMNA